MDFIETRILHPTRAFSIGEFRTAIGLDQHVETGKKTVGTGAPCIINERLMDDEHAACREGSVSLVQKDLPQGKVPSGRKYPSGYRSIGGWRQAKKTMADFVEYLIQRPDPIHDGGHFAR